MVTSQSIWAMNTYLLMKLKSLTGSQLIYHYWAFLKRSIAMFSQSDFADGIISGLIKNDPDTPTQFQPGLVLNDHKNGRKALEFLVGNLTACRSFVIAVAFVTRSGVACLHQSLKDFGDRGGRGSILVSTYLNFSDPNAIKALSKFSGIDVSFVNEPNFHGKTYLFEHDNYAQIMIGSSNLTQNALVKIQRLICQFQFRENPDYMLRQKIN